MMTSYDKLTSIESEEEAVDFLYEFANQVIEDFSNFKMPNPDRIAEYLKTEYVEIYK